MLSLPPSSWKNSCVRPWRGIFIFGTSHGHNGEKDINGVYNKISNLTTKKLQIEKNLFMQTNLILSEIEIWNGCQTFEMYKITLKTFLSYFLTILSRCMVSSTFQVYTTVVLQLTRFKIIYRIKGSVYEIRRGK